jgi:Transposase DDE domain
VEAEAEHDPAADGPLPVVQALVVQELDGKSFQGLKYFKKLLPLLQPLHKAGCERDKAGNRTLFYDHYACLILLQLFNPAVATLRLIQQASQLKKVQETLGCARTSLGSLSEAPQVFEPSLLLGVIDELGKDLKPLGRDPRLVDVKGVITLVDGSLLKALPQLAEAMWLTTRTGTHHGAWRLHAHFDLDKFVPVQTDLTNGKNSGKSDEKNVLRQNLAPDHCYVMDRWYAQFKLFNDIHAIGSGYVCRIRDNSVYKVLEDRPLSDAAKAAGVLSDQVVDLGQVQSGRERPDHPVRLVRIQTTPHEKRSNRKGNTGAGPSDGILRIATDQLDIPAETAALLYEKRYQIELFFRFFKSLLGCRHLISSDPRGIQIQVYCAVIACMLLNLYTNRRPDKATLSMAYWYLSGIATEQEWLDHLNRPDRRGEKLRAKAELWKKLGY